MKNENVTELKRLRDTLFASLAALINLGHPVDRWDDILIYIFSQKFSQRTRHEWNLKRSASSSELPFYKEFNEFLTLRIRGLTDLSDSSNNSSNIRNNNKSRSSVNSVSVIKCANCSGNHNLTKCEDFLSKSVMQRNAIVKQNKLCFNCLRSGHFTPTCKTKVRCTYCSRAHHSSMHTVNSEAPKKCVAQTAVVAQSQEKDSGAASTAAVASVQTIQTNCARA